jgi:uncharacterized protein with HEPN domain
MRSDTASVALRDITHHIDLAVHFTTGFNYEAFVADPRTVYAVIAALRSSPKRHAVCLTI